MITGTNNSNCKWVLTGSDVACIGNIENLLDYATVKSWAHPTMGNYCYGYMFYNCKALTQAPALSATTLAGSCYHNMMFNGCTKIKLSIIQTGEYEVVYRIPTAGTGTTATDALSNMFTNTGGTFKGAPNINTTYYLSNTNTVVG